MGYFIIFKNEETQEKRGLLRRNKVPKDVRKIYEGDFIGIEIEKIRSDGKIDLEYLEKDFIATYQPFLNETQLQLENLKIKNKEIR
ncbi:MAG: RNA-binding protein [Streptococcaceae bacterium]|nr:RNA-binding protein [Streptococcaceae bacterium]